MVIVVMGASGAGKTTVGSRLAAELGWPFRDADDLHAPASIERMRGGSPLTDAHRRPWLAALASLIGDHVRERRALVLACSALSRGHRVALLAETPDPADVRFVYLHAGAALLGERLKGRKDHFFPADLVATQLAELEDPGPETAPPALRLDAALPVDELVARIRGELGI